MSRLFVILVATAAFGADPPHPVLRWVKRHPLPTSPKPSPRMGYETSYGYDPVARVLIRYGGHNQGGGGEQNSEVWTYELDRDLWSLKEPNDAPPGVCCAQQNVFHDALGKFVRFPAFSYSHGWQSPREVALKNASVWTYDLASNTWRYMRPCPAVWPSPLRGAAYDPHHQVIVLHGGEGSRHGTCLYDLYTNTWHRLEPKPAPPSNLSQPGFTYDAVNRVFVLFGSQFASDPRTWLYDLRTNTWRVLAVERHPPAEKSCPVLAADTRNGVVLCNIFFRGKLETWVLDVANATWSPLNLEREPDTSGARNRVLLYLPDRNLFFLENRVRKEQQVWTFRYADAPPLPPRARDLRVVTTENSATLAWKQPQEGSGWRYDILRGAGGPPWKIELRPVARGLSEMKWTDRALRRGTVYYYQVRAIAPDGKPAGLSYIRRTQPPVVLDLTVSVLSPRRVELEWEPPESEDIAGYLVERAVVSVYSTDQVLRIKGRYRHTSDLAVGGIRRIGQFERLTLQPVAQPRFVDQSADLVDGPREPEEPALGGTPLRPDRLDPNGRAYRYAVYAYRVRVVNRLGVVGGPSPFLFTYPRTVENVFAKEENDTATRIRWQPVRQRGIVGYLVYRQDGRWNKDPISLLTPKPIQATEFLDTAAGNRTRRYEVVAVDSLGQEGEPSRPVWSRREWRRFYIPYTTEWHQ